MMNELVEAARLPVEQQLDAVQRVVDARPRVDQPARAWLVEVAGEQARCQAELRTLVLALAAERYRLAEGTWPESAAELVRAGYVPAVPLDPYDGQPMRYRRLLDGVVFYSVGHDRVDNGGNIDRTNPVGTGVDLGCRLYDPKARRRLPVQQ